MRALLVALVSLVALADGAGPLPQPRAGSGESGTLAVLRRDGVVVPFASYEAGRWLNRWPEPGRRLDIPISIDATPKSWWLRDVPVASWTAWPIQGESRVIRVRNPVNLTVQCERHLGLQTDYSSILPPVPRDMQPHPKDGLAASGDIVVEPVELLTSASPDWGKVLEALKEPFATAEGRAVAKSNRYAEQDPQRRAQFPLEIEVLFRSAGSRPGTQVLYFEAVRRYSRRPQSQLLMTLAPDRRPLAYGAGWAVQTGGTVTLQGQVTVALSDNEREDLLYLLPLGTVRLGDRRYWAAQRAGWGFEQFEIIEMTDKEPKVAFKTAGGACR